MRGRPDLAHQQLLFHLRNTSRSFYLSVRYLPGKIRFTVALAYLLARTTDTIADANGLAAKTRLDLLAQLPPSLQEGSPAGVVARYDEIEVHSAGAERALLEQLGRMLTQFRRLPARHRGLVEEVITKIVRGQSLDLKRFEMQPGLTALQTDQELEEYTYLVAGCVGEFWTALCCFEWPRYSRIPEVELLPLGAAFGRALQLINILRDLPVDVQHGRCYLPIANPADLVVNLAVVEPEFEKWRQRALEQLDLAWRYVKSIRPVRVRFACALPVLIGLRTLNLLKSPEKALAQSKISHREMSQVIFLAVVVALMPMVASLVYRNERKRLANS
jgi:farnesyl-diphosphate farnesyltransferase